jgi:predicted RNA-binding Zn ribbon-like protein
MPCEAWQSSWRIPECVARTALFSSDTYLFCYTGVMSKIAPCGNGVKQPMREPRDSQTHRLIGNDLSLDFANTLNGHGHLEGHEYLRDYRDIVLWAEHAEILPASEAETLLNRAADQPAVARRAYRKAIVLRESIFRVFAAIAGGQEPASADIEFLASEWRKSQCHLRLVRLPDGYALGWDDEPALEGALRKICSAAVSLLTSEEAGRIGQCSGEACDWLFVNRSRNHLRRWCSMDECGNRAKMQRRQARMKLCARQDVQAEP